MANICDTQYKVTGSPKAVADLWNTLQELEVNSNNVYLYLLAEHYGIDYEKKGISSSGMPGINSRSTDQFCSTSSVLLQ